MGDESDKPDKSKDFAKHDLASKSSSGFRDEGKKSEKLKVLFAKYKGSPKEIGALLTAAEKRIREFVEVVTKRVSDFLDNDFKQLKEVSKEELTKMNTALLDYKDQLEKISQEKIKSVAEIKSKLQTRIMTAEEVQSFVKYFDERMTEVKKITQDIIDIMRKSKKQVADNFATDLQTVVADYSKRVIKAMDGLFSALKDAAEDLSKSVPDKKTIMTKMPTTLAIQKMPSMLNNAFKKMRATSSGVEDSGKSREGFLMPSTLRAKFPRLNLSKHFNSETTYGRANVAKATYVGALLYFLYWKFKKSKS